MTIAFYIAALVTLAFAIGVVINRNPVTSALCLVASFVGLAALFVTLNAYFIGTMQVLVYAGAVMVLFIFIIMLMDLKKEERRKINVMAVLGAGLVGVGFVLAVTEVLHKLPQGQKGLPEIAAMQDHTYHDVKAVGHLLYSGYPFHLQIIGLLLLTATIGVIVLSKKEAK
jgi:NADH-quinone oxidoreductase subunit J